MRKIVLASAAILALSGVGASLSPADAVGCLSGGAVGAVAGHVAGHHALLGAAAGCAIGHHEASKNSASNAPAATGGTQPATNSVPARP
jgi:hypothetical protein